jgi:hypothetical protein
MVASPAKRYRLDLHSLIADINANRRIYVTDGEGLFEIIGVRQKGVFILSDCRVPVGGYLQERDVLAAHLALGYSVVTPG